MEGKLHMARIEKVCRKKEHGGLDIIDVDIGMLELIVA